MGFTLTIKQRYDLLHHVGRLPCTVALRYAIDDFQKMIDFTSDEIVEKEITIDKATFQISSNDDAYVVEYNELPGGVVQAIKHFISRYDIEDMKKNEFVQSALELFKSVV